MMWMPDIPGPVTHTTHYGEVNHCFTCSHLRPYYLMILPSCLASAQLRDFLKTSCHHHCQDMTRSHSDLQFLPALLERWICLAILLPLVCGPSGFRGHGEEVGMWWALAFFVAAFTVIRGLSMNLWLSSEDHLCNTINTWFWGYRGVDDCGRFLNLNSFKLYGNAEVQTFHALQHESADRKLWWGQSRCDQMLFMSVRWPKMGFTTKTGEIDANKYSKRVWHCNSTSVVWFFTIIYTLISLDLIALFWSRFIVIFAPFRIVWQSHDTLHLWTRKISISLAVFFDW